MIKVNNVSFSYPTNGEASYSLKNINLDIQDGEVIVLCGESGCGKTTLTRVMNGLIPNFYEGEMDGEVIVSGQNVTKQALEITAKTVGSIFQNPRSQFFNVDTTGEVVFGCENLNLEKEETLRRLRSVSHLFEIEELLNRSIFELSGGEKQRIACASIYASNPDVFVFDEPSSNLDAHSIKLLRKAIELLVKQKKTVIVSEHRLYYLADLATRYIYMKDGEIKEEFTPHQMKALSAEKRRSLGLRNIEFTDIAQDRNNQTIDYKSTGNLKVDKLKVKYGKMVALDISKLRIPKNKVVAIIGENGAGKSSFANALVGLEHCEDSILLENKALGKKQRLKKGFMVMQEVGHQLFTQSVEEELALNIPEENLENIHTVLRKLSLEKLKDKHPLSLSGGEKQRVAIASSVCAGKDLIIYDEPTSGLDYKNMIKASDLIKELSQTTDCSIVITHDLEFILNACEYVVEIKNGSVASTYTLDNEGVRRVCEYFEKQQKPQKKNYEENSMKKILHYAGKDKKYIFSAIALLLVSTICGIVPFFLLNNIIIDLIDKQFDFEKSLPIIVGIAIFLIAKTIFYSAGLGLSHLGAFNILYNIRTIFSRKMTKHSMGHIMSEGTGKYKKTFVEDISSLETALAHMIPEGVPYVCGTIFTLIAIFIVDFRIGFVQLIMIPLSMISMILMMKVSMEKIPDYYKSREDLNSTLVEYISGMEAIKIFNKADTSYGKLRKSITNAKEFTIDWSNETAKYMSVLYSLLPCTLLVTLPLAIFMYVKGVMELSALTLIIMLCLSLSEPLLKLVNFLPSVTAVDFALKQCENVFLHEDVKSGNFDEMSDNYNVTFRDVSFAYEDNLVLKNINLEIKQNSICAIVGISGSGKSTLAKLLMHFWDIPQGEILIGGKDITEFTFENLMNHISYVSQENNLFEGTIFDNIAIAKEHVTKTEVIAACKSANCHDFIMSLENGYDTNVGMLGKKLSGGERQRITIARAIIKDAPIVILDEATAFADAENEALIQEALSTLLVGKTVIIIAHKLYTITKANQIVVLKNGEIEMCDTHKQLLLNCKTYQKLWRISEESTDWDLGGER